MERRLEDPGLIPDDNLEENFDEDPQEMLQELDKFDSRNEKDGSD